MDLVRDTRAHKLHRRQWLQRGSSASAEAIRPSGEAQIADSETVSTRLQFARANGPLHCSKPIANLSSETAPVSQFALGAP